MPRPCEFLFTESSPHLGGQELQLLQQMRQLRQLDHSVALACRPASRIREQAQALGLRVIPLPFRNLVDMATWRGLRRLFAQERPRCVICHSGHDANLAALAARLVRRRPRLVRSKTYVAGQPSTWSHNHLVDATMIDRNSLFQRRGRAPDKSTVKR